MNEALLFGVLASLLYGLNNFVARFANRSSGVTATLFWGQWFLVIVIGLTGGLIGEVSGASLGSPPLIWAALILYSLMIAGATGCLYLGLSKGRISIVVPVMASYGAVGAIVSWIGGESLSWPVAGSIAVVVCGAVLSALPSQSSQSDRASGWLPALAASFLFGAGYWIQGRFVLPSFGVISTIWVYNLIAAALVSGWAVTRQKSVRPPRTLSDFGLILLTGALGGGGFVALSLAQRQGDVAIATALSSTSTAVAVALAFLFLKERPGFKSWAGIVAVIGGVAGLHLFA